MKLSPIQLLETTLDKVLVQVNSKYDPDDQEEKGFEVVDLQFHHACELASDYWENSSSSDFKDRTFRVQLGVRTAPDEAPKGPYLFEVVCSGVVACTKDRLSETLSAHDGALEYGQSLLYGVIRDQLLSMTARMQYGVRMLPTVSFMGDSRKLAGKEKAPDKVGVVEDSNNTVN